MKRQLAITLVLLISGAGPASAQIIGMPVWNDPNAGSGITLSADAGFPDESSQGTTFAARGNVGLGGLQVGATVGTRGPDVGDRVTSLGGTLAFRVLGGTVLPVAVNAQAGLSTEGSDPDNFTRLTTAVGIGLKAPVPGVQLQIWLSPGARFLRHTDGSGARVTDTNFGVAAGASLGLGLLGVHAGIDHENTRGNSAETIFGVGLHLGLHAPVGM